MKIRLLAIAIIAAAAVACSTVAQGPGDPQADHERATLAAIAHQFDLYAAEAARNAVENPTSADFYRGVEYASISHAIIVREQAERGEWPVPITGPAPTTQQLYPQGQRRDRAEP